MTQEKIDASELFYSFFSFFKPRRVRGGSVTDEWLAHVLPHSPIQELAPSLWHVTGILPPAPREMVIYKLAELGLLIHSAIALDEAGITQLESLGTPKIMIVPNRIHRIDASVYKRRYRRVSSNGTKNRNKERILSPTMYILAPCLYTGRLLL